jgi:probable rRNA maturation factor
MMDDPDPGGSRDAIVVVDEAHAAVDTERLRGTAMRALAHLGVAGELSISLLEPDAMAALKEQALGVRAATDVLSFPLDDPRAPSPGPVLLGDIVICPVVAERQARALGRTLDEEIAHLVVHGLLHILGRDHADPASERAMAAEQRAILAAIKGTAA